MNFPFIDGDVPRSTSYGVYISQLNHFARVLSHADDFNNRNKVILGWAYRGLTGGFLLLQNFSDAISVSAHVCFILVLILISMFLR